VNVNEFRRAFSAPFSAIVLEIAYQFLLFRVNRYDRLIRSQERLGLRIDVLKLGVAIDVIGAFPRLAVGLQAIAHAAQKIADHRGANLMPFLRQLLCKIT
jgi:uncharacterized membrane protein YadS